MPLDPQAQALIASLAGGKPVDQRAAPLRARYCSKLPAAFVIAAEFDPLRDAGRADADRLLEVGTPVVYRDYAGMVHGFVTSAGAIDRGKQSIRAAAAELRSAFRVPTSATAG